MDGVVGPNEQHGVGIPGDGDRQDHLRALGEQVEQIELPYWRDPHAADLTPDPSRASRRDTVLQSLDREEAAFARLRSLYDAASPLPASPFRDATESFLRVGENGQTQAQRQAVPSDPAYDRPATVAEAFSAIDSGHMTRLRLGRMLLRAVPPDDQGYSAVAQTFDEWCADAAADNQAERRSRSRTSSRCRAGRSSHCSSMPCGAEGRTAEQERSASLRAPTAS